VEATVPPVTQATVAEAAVVEAGGALVIVTVGGLEGGATTAVSGETADADPAAFEAETRTRIEEPSSAELSM
jgi:hypothetical protein